MEVIPQVNKTFGTKISFVLKKLAKTFQGVKRQRKASVDQRQSNKIDKYLVNHKWETFTILDGPPNIILIQSFW